MAVNRTYLIILLICFFTTGRAQNYYTNKKTIAEKNDLLKVNVSSLLRADYCLSYEKKITPHLSAEVTAGFTCYTKFMESYDFFNYRPENMVAAKRQYTAQPSLKIAGRYYLNGAKKEITGSYFSVEGMFRRYGSSVKDYPASTMVREKSDQREIRLLWGSQNNDIHCSTFYDCSLGFGYRFHERNYLGYTEASKFSNQRIFNGKKNYLVFVINLKAGFNLR